MDGGDQEVVEEAPIKPFDTYFDYPMSTINYFLNKGSAWALANSFYRKNKPCLLDVIYYLEKHIEYIPIQGALFDENGRITGATFEDFEIFYTKRGWDYKFRTDIKEIEKKYGEKFPIYFGLIVAGMNEDAVCRALMNAIIGYELNKTLTDLGIRALYTIAAVKMEFFRFRPKEEFMPMMPMPKPEFAREKVRKEAMTVFIPNEIVEIADKIKEIAQKYNVNPHDVLDIIRRLL